MTTNPRPSHFWQVEFATFKLKTLWVADRLFIKLASRSRVAIWHPVLARLLSGWGQRSILVIAKEILKSLIQVFQGLLQDLTICLPKPFKIRVAILELSESKGCTLVVQGLARHEKMFLAQLKRSIVHEARMSKLAPKGFPKFSFLFFGWVKAKLKGFQDFHDQTFALVERALTLETQYGLEFSPCSHLSMRRSGGDSSVFLPILVWLYFHLPCMNYTICMTILQIHTGLKFVRTQRVPEAHGWGPSGQRRTAFKPLYPKPEGVGLYGLFL